MTTPSPRPISKSAANAVAASRELRAEYEATRQGIDIPKRRRKPRRPGPRTEAGKAAVALNAVKHGITAGRVPLPNEDMDEWLSHRQSIFDAYNVVGAVEEMLAVRIAELSWRLRRVMPYEETLAATARERVPLEFKKKFGWGDIATVEEAEELVEGAIEAKESLTVQPDPHHPLMKVSSSEFEAAIEDAGASGEVPALRPENGIWTAGTIAHAVGALARERGLTVDDMTEQIAGYLEGRAMQHRKRLNFILDEQDRMRRDRILPPQLELLTLNKYETGLHRMLFQTMHELEAAQARRRGQPIPLARVHITSGG